MSQTINTYAPFPPTGTQVVRGAGVLESIVIPARDALIESSLAGVSYVRLSSVHRASVRAYDSATGRADLSTPILDFDRMGGMKDLAIKFEKGLYVVQMTQSTLAVTWQ